MNLSGNFITLLSIIMTPLQLIPKVCDCAIIMSLALEFSTKVYKNIIKRSTNILVIVKFPLLVYSIGLLAILVDKSTMYFLSYWWFITWQSLGGTGLIIYLPSLLENRFRLTTFISISPLCPCILVIARSTFLLILHFLCLKA